MSNGVTETILSLPTYSYSDKDPSDDKVTKQSGDGRGVKTTDHVKHSVPVHDIWEVKQVLTKSLRSRKRKSLLKILIELNKFF